MPDETCSLVGSLALVISCDNVGVAVVGMSLMLAFLMPVRGIGLAGMYLFQTLWQSVRGLMRLYQSAESLSAKRRILATVACCVVGVICGGTLLPMPGLVQGVGVVRRSEDQTIHAATPGLPPAGAVPA